MNWCVYIILCTDNSFYTGITTDVSRRFNQHGNQQGARYFRGRQPKEILYVEAEHNRSSASKREIMIKKMSRLEKLRLITSGINQVNNFR